MYQWNKGDVIQRDAVPEELAHLFDNPEQYHWNYPHENGYQIMKNVRIMRSGGFLVLEFK